MPFIALALQGLFWDAIQTFNWIGFYPAVFVGCASVAPDLVMKKLE